MKAVMFAGGVGTRLWPLSRKRTPKQFEKIVDNSSMLQIAVAKLYPDFKPEDIFITTGKVYRDTVVSQLPDIPAKNIITEPEMRDVGPAVGLVAALFEKMNPHEPFVLLWGSDHLVKEAVLFRRVLKYAGSLVEKNPNKMIFVGQKPRYANQNLGWIEFGEQLDSKNGINVYEFKGLKYRPEISTAIKFFEDGHHAWNLGYFVTTPTFLWGLFKEFSFELYKELLKIQEAYGTKRFDAVLGETYPKLKKISFDDAVLEKLDHRFAEVISENLGWSDVGAWDALKEALETYPADNVTKGKSVLKDTTDTLVYNFDEKKLVVCIDIDASIVVNTPDVLLITKKKSVPKVKKLVESFAKTEYEELT